MNTVNRQATGESIQVATSNIDQRCCISGRRIQKPAIGNRAPATRITINIHSESISPAQVYSTGRSTGSLQCYALIIETRNFCHLVQQLIRTAAATLSTIAYQLLEIVPQLFSARNHANVEV